ncbi:MAG: hypothetical protein ACRC0V_08520, partial [Fusobacteriaceae bacterium]
YTGNIDYNFSFLKEEKTILLSINRGCIIDDKNNILLILTKEVNNWDIDTDSFKLFVSTKLFEEKYKNFYKRIYTDLIEKDFIKKGIEVSYLPSEKIEETLFKNSFKLVFNTLDELSEYIEQDEINNLLFLEEREKELEIKFNRYKHGIG